MKAHLTITLKPGVLDPQGKAIEDALHGLGFSQVREARQGKLIVLDIDENDPQRARNEIDRMCTALLANTVIEDYKIEILTQT